MTASARCRIGGILHTLRTICGDYGYSRCMFAAAEDMLVQAGSRVGEKKEEPSETLPEGDLI